MVEAAAAEGQSLGNIPADHGSPRRGIHRDLIVNAHPKADSLATIMQEGSIQTTADIADARLGANMRESYSEPAPSYEAIKGSVSHL